MVPKSKTTPAQTIRPQISDSATLPEGVISVALIEDNRLVREALTSLLNRAPDIRAVAEAPNGHERVVLEASPDVVLLDLGLENGDSLRVARDVMQDFPQARVIVMDLLPAHEELREFVSAGVSGFIMKDANFDVVLDTIRSVAGGLKVLPDQMTATLFSEIVRNVVSTGESNNLDSVRMTSREREVINLIAEGLSNKAIGKRLNISVHTVKSHLRNIMEKLTLHSRLQIAAYAHKREADE
jgi:DNA-binding NarL/FixJ family response regulator